MERVTPTAALLVVVLLVGVVGSGLGAVDTEARRTVMVLVETDLPASHFAGLYERTGVVLTSEEAFVAVNRSLWIFRATSEQYSLLRERLAAARSLSVIATSSRSDDEVGASYSTALWNLDRIDQRTNAYDSRYEPGAGYTGANTHLYVLDSGVVPNSTELGGRVALEWTAFGGQYADDNNHGSHVAGVAAGTGHGVAKLALVHSYKVLNSAGTGTLSRLAQALMHLRGSVLRPAVVNLSLAYSGFDAVIDALLTELITMGVTVVAAGGNGGRDACSTYPCVTSGVICVGATTRYDQRASFSNYGPCVDVWAPGSQIRSIGMDGAELLMSGTSMATPHVSAACLLYLQANPQAAPSQVAAALIAVSTKNQLHAATLGARSPNRLLYVVWGSTPVVGSPSSSLNPSTSSGKPLHSRATGEIAPPTYVVLILMVLMLRATCL